MVAGSQSLEGSKKNVEDGMMISGRQIRGGERMPRGYAKAYTFYDRDAAVFYPIPVAIIVRAFMYCKHHFDVWRGAPTWVDKQVEAAMRQRNLEDAERHRVLWEHQHQLEEDKLAFERDKAEFLGEVANGHYTVFLEQIREQSKRGEKA
jgi:hypothetical protein